MAAVSGVRRAYLDRSPGEARAVVLLDGRPERLLVAWEDDPTPRLGARYAARVEAVSERLGLARLDLGAAAGSMKLKAGARVAVGERLEAEVVGEPVRDKPASLRRIGPSDSVPGRLSPPPPLEAALRALGLDTIETGEEAREVADAAQADALALEYAFPGGLNLRVEPTRALTAVDVDLAESGGAVSVTRANEAAIGHAARLLRLKAQGGLVAIDLIGSPREGRRLQELAVAAFAADGAEVRVAAPSRFGVLELSKPNRRQPLAEQLAPSQGRASAHELVRAMERQGRHAPGALLRASASPALAALAEPWVRRLGPRFSVRAELGLPAGAYDISV